MPSTHWICCCSNCGCGTSRPNKFNVTLAGFDLKDLAYSTPDGFGFYACHTTSTYPKTIDSADGEYVVANNGVSVCEYASTLLPCVWVRSDAVFSESEEISGYTVGGAWGLRIEIVVAKSDGTVFGGGTVPVGASFTVRVYAVRYLNNLGAEQALTEIFSATKYVDQSTIDAEGCYGSPIEITNQLTHSCPGYTTITNILEDAIVTIEPAEPDAETVNYLIDDRLTCTAVPNGNFRRARSCEDDSVTDLWYDSDGVTDNQVWKQPDGLCVYADLSDDPSTEPGESMVDTSNPQESCGTCIGCVACGNCNFSNLSKAAVEAAPSYTSGDGTNTYYVHIPPLPLATYTTCRWGTIDSDGGTRGVTVSVNEGDPVPAANVLIDLIRDGFGEPLYFYVYMSGIEAVISTLEFEVWATDCEHGSGIKSLFGIPYGTTGGGEDEDPAVTIGGTGAVTIGNNSVCDDNPLP